MPSSKPKIHTEMKYHIPKICNEKYYQDQVFFNLRSVCIIFDYAKVLVVSCNEEGWLYKETPTVLHSCNPLRFKNDFSKFACLLKIWMKVSVESSGKTMPVCASHCVLRSIRFTLPSAAVKVTRPSGYVFNSSKHRRDCMFRSGCVKSTRKEGPAPSLRDLDMKILSPQSQGQNCSHSTWDEKYTMMEWGNPSSKETQWTRDPFLNTDKSGSLFERCPFCDVTDFAWPKICRRCIIITSVLDFRCLTETNDQNLKYHLSSTYLDVCWSMLWCSFLFWKHNPHVTWMLVSSH